MMRRVCYATCSPPAGPRGGEPALLLHAAAPRVRGRPRQRHGERVRTFQVRRCRKVALDVLAVQVWRFTFPPPLYSFKKRLMLPI